MNHDPATANFATSFRRLAGVGPVGLTWVPVAPGVLEGDASVVPCSIGGNRDGADPPESGDHGLSNMVWCLRGRMR